MDTSTGLAITVATVLTLGATGAFLDIAVVTNGLLSGHVELKAPGTGANVKKFKGRNEQQWENFKALPNLVYTDGNEWALYRSGERQGRILVLSGDVTGDADGAVDDSDADELSTLLRDFFSWDPIVPNTPRKLAEMLAPYCHLVRDDVLRALEDEGSALSLLAAQWRDNLFSDADAAQFATPTPRRSPTPCSSPASPARRISLPSPPPTRSRAATAFWRRRCACSATRRRGPRFPWA